MQYEIRTMADIIPVLHDPEIFCLLAAFSTFLCALDLLILGITMFSTHRQGSQKGKLIFLLICLLMHFLDAKSYYHFNGEMGCRAAAAVSQLWITYAGRVWTARFVSILLAVCLALWDLGVFPFSLFKSSAMAPENSKSGTSKFVPFEGLWVRRWWVLYFAGAFVGCLGWLLIIALCVGMLLFLCFLVVFLVAVPFCILVGAPVFMAGLRDEVHWLWIVSSA
jgi:hypothetical protein